MNYKNLIKGGFYSVLLFSSLNANIKTHKPLYALEDGNSVHLTYNPPRPLPIPVAISVETMLNIAADFNDDFDTKGLSPKKLRAHIRQSATHTDKAFGDELTKLTKTLLKEYHDCIQEHVESYWDELTTKFPGYSQEEEEALVEMIYQSSNKDCFIGVLEETVRLQTRFSKNLNFKEIYNAVVQNVWGGVVNNQRNNAADFQPIATDDLPELEDSSDNDDEDNYSAYDDLENTMHNSGSDDESGSNDKQNLKILLIKHK